MDRIIEYKGVEVLRNEHVALRNVSFSVAPGEFVYLLGRVGSGKTSLLKSLYAEVPVEKGEARIFDYDLRNIQSRDIPFLRRRIGIVFQDFQLLSDRTAYANLEFVLDATGWRNKSEKEARIDAVLKQVGMATKAFKMPHLRRRAAANCHRASATQQTGTHHCRRADRESRSRDGRADHGASVRHFADRRSSSDSRHSQSWLRTAIPGTRPAVRAEDAGGMNFRASLFV